MNKWLILLMVFYFQFQASAVLIEAPALKPWVGDLDGMKKRRIIRILVPYSKTIYFLDKGRQYGTAVGLGEALEAWLNKGKTKQIEKISVAFVPTARENLFKDLNEGRGDIVAANLTITNDRLKIVDFTNPMIKEVKEILVTGPAAPAINNLRELSGKKIHVRKSSSYWTHLIELNIKFKSEKLAPIDIQPIDENLEDEDILEMVNAGLLEWCVVDSHLANLWVRIFKNLKIRNDIVISEHGGIAWAIRKNSPLLMAELNLFEEKHGKGTTFGNLLGKQYFHSDKMLRKAYDPKEMDRFKSLLALFGKHGETYKFDDILLAAQGYQESQLDQARRSPRGAVGIMQVLPSTASDKAVNIKNIDKSEDRNIEAGAKYLRHLLDIYIKDNANDELNRTLFALAAYNAGPGNLNKFRKKAEALGLKDDVWFGNVENGAAAVVGRETVQYVGNIYKYYIAYKLYLQQEQSSAQSKKAPLN